MPHHESIALTGVIRHVFAHRFTLEADGTVHLADLGPKGLDAFPLSEGLDVTLRGERRPSEIKVTEIVAPGRDTVHIHHNKPNHAPDRPRPNDQGEPGKAWQAAILAGWTPHGQLRRKPKHFEVLARQAEGPWTELHVDFDGKIHKTKTADAVKWDLADA